MQHTEQNDLRVPLTSKSRIVNFLLRNKSMNKVAYTPVVICMISGGILLLILSIYMFVVISKVRDLEVLYSTAGDQNCKPGQTCVVSFTVEKDMKAPVYLLYKLDDFYQNHRRYIASKSNKQLLGHTITSAEASICSPYITNADMKVTTSWGGTPLDPTAVASPCGTIAYTYFNDVFELTYQGNPIPIDQNGITWANDVRGKFKRSTDSSQTQWVDPENEHFINWMRVAGLPGFSKLWGRINQNLQAGQYTMNIQNNYNIVQWSGNRYFKLTTDSTAGGSNYLLPIQFLITSIVAFVMAAFIWLRSKRYRLAINE